MQSYLMIGEVLKPQGIRGEVKIRPCFSDPEAFLGWDTLYVKRGDGYAPIRCSGNRLRDGFAYAVLDGAATMTEAEKQRGLVLYIDRAHAAQPPEGDVFISDLIGCEAFDEAGVRIGVLRDVLQHGPVDTWVFDTPRGMMMAPALKAAFPVLDVANGRISVCAERLAEVAVYDAD